MRVAGPTPEAEDVYSPMLAGWTFPSLYEKDDRKWAAPSPIGSDAAGRPSTATRSAPRSTRAARPLVLDRNFQTQSIDQVFLEPEGGLAWYDSATRKLELVIGVQSPRQVAANIATLVAKNAADQAVKEIVAHCAYVGGAFGGRDHTIFPLYAALAGLFSPGRPVRLANDRFDQFQFGIKRHAFGMRSRMAVDKASGRIAAFAADQDLDGGGLANLSAAVAFVGAAASIGMYDVPKVDVDDGGAAYARRHGRLDARLRRLADHDRARSADRRGGREPRPRPGRLPPANLLKTGGKTMVGNVISGYLRSAEVLDRLASKPVWSGRAAEKARRAAAHPDKALRRRPRVRQHGIWHRFRSGLRPGRARPCRPHHRRLAGGRDRHRHRDRARGPRRRQARHRRRRGEARRPRSLGCARPRRARRPVLHHRASTRTRRQESALGSRRRAGHHRLQRRPCPHRGRRRGGQRRSSASASSRRRWRSGRRAVADRRPESFSASRISASSTASSPPRDGAAAALPPRRQGPRDGTRHRRDGSRLQSLGLGERRPSICPTAATKARSTRSRCRYGNGAPAARKALMTAHGYHRLDRVSVTFPPTLSNGSTSAIVGAAAPSSRSRSTRSGAVTILDGVTVMECGRAIVPELVEGQAEGGFAMGVGYALHEYLPLYEDGPGNGTWNLDRYHVPRASDLPVWNLEIDVLPPLGPTDVPKGIAELVMIPVPPAVLNAISDATGKRFDALPVTADMIKAAL